MAVKHKPKRKPASGNPYLNQARSLSKVRFGPEQSALSQLLDDALSTLQTGIGAQEGAARGIQASVKAASPVIKKTYGDAQGTTDVANGQVASDLGKLGASADPYRATTAREAAGAKRRIAEGLAGAIKELQDRSVAAEQGRAFGVTNEVNQYKAAVDKVQKRRSDLAGEIGAFESSTIGDLKSENAKAQEQARKDALDTRRVINSERSTDAQITGIDPATGLPTLSARKQAAAKKAKKNKPRFTTVQLTSHRAMWKKGLTLAAQAKVKRADGNKFVAFLVSKGVDEPVARGAVQQYLFHGVRAKQRRVLERDYGLKPSVIGLFG